MFPGCQRRVSAYYTQRAQNSELFFTSNRLELVAMRLRFNPALLAAFLLVLFAAEARAETTQSIYDDSLASGWQDWSWSSRDFNSADYVHQGTKSIKITYTAQYQGFYLRHMAMDSTPFTSLVFWINGGAVSGRSITIAAQLDDVAQPGVPFAQFIEDGTVAASSWKKVTVPLASLGVANKSNFSGFWLQDASGGAQPPFYIDDIGLLEVPPPSQVHVSVDASSIVRTVDRRHFGVAAAIWDSHFNTQATASLLAANGTRISRFPGGSLSDDYHWKTNTTGINTWQWATSFDAFAGVMQAIGADAFITVNYGSGTVQEAADWVQYSNLTKGYGFHYWEVGNENYGSWENDTRSRAHDPYTYGLAFRDYASAMKAVDPSIKVGAVVITGEDAYANYSDHSATNPRTSRVHNGWTPVLLSTLKSLGVTPDFVILHRYEQGPGQESDSGLLQAARTWSNDTADLRQQLNDYLGAGGANVELVCTENNSVYSNPGKQTTSLVNGLYYADSFAQFVQTEFSAFIWWDLRNSQEHGNNNSASLYGWRNYGDYGMVSDQNDRYPVYYASSLMSRFVSPGDQIVRAASDYNWLGAYGATRADGSLSLLLINKSESNSLNASVNLSAFTPSAHATVYSYGKPQDEAARTGSDSPDIATGSFDSASSSFTYTVAPYSIVVLNLSPFGSQECQYSLSIASKKFKARGGSDSISVSTHAGCAWQATSNVSWISFTSPSEGTGSGVVAYSVAGNTTGASRKGRISIGGQVVNIKQKAGQ